ncbi:hypothetical protein [Actinomadura rayongensis]|uniref:Uncharacterized protein n=1 Tax=Actinomadura rayongensis TaxID=1429076 RepID=A0A6I4W2N6_9ACTN|nr:hypothetical protein [Actinomadura rayongensis]MXQ62536.1 hypothetical protein [Actinomadura rayongensis]
MADQPHEESAPKLIAHATRWVDVDGYPYIIEVVFTDANGQQHSIIDKTPLFWFDNDEEPDLDTELPVPAYLDAVILRPNLADGRVRIAIDHRSINNDGYAEFTVKAQQLT